MSLNRFSMGKTDSTNLNKPGCFQFELCKRLHAFHRLFSSQNELQEHPNLATSFTAVKTVSTNLDKPSTCVATGKMESRYFHKRQQAFSVVKTDSLQAFNRLCISQNGVHKPLQASNKPSCSQIGLYEHPHASNKLLGSQNEVHEPPKAGNKLYCRENGLHEPLHAFKTHCHRKNGLQEPIQAAKKVLL